MESVETVAFWLLVAGNAAGLFVVLAVVALGVLLAVGGCRDRDGYD
jgi:hypothetical protein